MRDATASNNEDLSISLYGWGARTFYVFLGILLSLPFVDIYLRLGWSAFHFNDPFLNLISAFLIAPAIIGYAAVLFSKSTVVRRHENAIVVCGYFLGLEISRSVYPLKQVQAVEIVPYVVKGISYYQLRVLNRNYDNMFILAVRMNGAAAHLAAQEFQELVGQKD